MRKVSVTQARPTRVSAALVPSAIVGYAGDARYRDMREPVLPTVYVPFSSEGRVPSSGSVAGAPDRGLDWATFMVRLSSGDRPDIVQTLSREVTRARSEFRVVGVHAQTELVDQHLVRERLLAVLSAFFASVALLLAAVGMYGSIHQRVVRRRRDLGIRIALGAPPRSVVLQATTGILAVLATGTAAGLAAGLASQRYFQGLLYQVTAADWQILALSILTIVVAAVLAALAPVVRAVRIDPVTTLRAE